MVLITFGGIIVIILYIESFQLTRNQMTENYGHMFPAAAKLFNFASKFGISTTFHTFMIFSDVPISI